MNEQAIMQQSKAAYGQWAVQWREHAKTNSQFKMKSLHDFENSGIGRAVLCVANGYSLEENIDTIRELQQNVDILCCDKTLGNLLDHGVIPDFCMVCDANVNYEKYLKPWQDKLSETILFSNVCGNPEWTKNGNWKDKYFFVNKDIIDSHLEFAELSGCPNTIPAGTNVSNAMVILLTQSDNGGRRNFFGYDKALLIGYDYSWRSDGKYYAFDADGGGKFNYMRHIIARDMAGSDCYTSGNLTFSSQWFEKYAGSFKLPIVQCSRHTIVSSLPFGDLKEQMGYSFKPEDSVTVKKKVNLLREIEAKKKQLMDDLHAIGREHHFSFLATV